MAVRRQLRRREVLYLEGEQPAGFYLIESGWVKTFRSSQGGREVVLDIVGPLEGMGPCCGSVRNCSHGCSAAALTPAQVLWVRGLDWRILVRECPTLRDAVTDMLFKSRRRCVDLAVGLALHDIDSRLAALLLKLGGYRDGAAAESRPIAHVLSQQDMASAIGTAREVVTRHLARFVQRGILSRSGRRIMVNEPRTLLSMAKGT